MAQTQTSGSGSSPSAKESSQSKGGMSMKEYEELVGRLVSRQGVKGVAVTNGTGSLVYHNNGLEPDILDTYIEVISSIEYLCTVAARENDPRSQWQYIRFETDEYEMMVTVNPTHWIFLLAEPQEAYNGEKEEESLSTKYAAAV